MKHCFGFITTLGWSVLLLCAAEPTAWAQNGAGLKVQGHFNVLINWLALPSVCATQSGGSGRVVGQVVCLSGESPSFNIPRSNGIFSLAPGLSKRDIALQVPNAINFNGLSPTATGHPQNDSRNFNSAELSADPGTLPPEEIEVSF